jgi:DNA invertase Pin-like site-specific DNA recombinase
MKKRVAAYCRVSTKYEEQTSSLEQQIDYYTNFIKSNSDMKFVGVFYDRKSGRNTIRRNGFNLLMKECVNGKVDMIYTKSISRFARNTVDFLETMRMLKTLGVTVIFENEHINTSQPISEFAVTLFAAYAQAESESKSSNYPLGNTSEIQKRC